VLGMRLFSILVLCGGALTYADCVDGGRATTEAERAFYASTMRRIEAAVPAAPAGWKLEARPSLPLGASTCKGADFSRLSYTVTYANMERIQAASKRSDEMSRQVAALREVPAEKATEMAELSKQSRALQRERPKVRSTGDKVAIDALEAQINDLNRRWADIRKAHEELVQPRILEITKQYLAAEQGANVYVRVTVDVNDPKASGAAKRGELRVGSLTLRTEGEKDLVAQIVKLWNLEAARAGM
jgi:hypothetical protein